MRQVDAEREVGRIRTMVGIGERGQAAIKERELFIAVLSSIRDGECSNQVGVCRDALQVLNLELGDVHAGSQSKA